MKKLLLSLLTIVSLYGQAQQVLLNAPVPPAVDQINVTTVGPLGNSTYYYYVVANYPIGKIISNSKIIRNAPDTYTNTNYIQISWNGVPGATSYDIIRSKTTPNVFTKASSGSCTACVVVLAVTATTYADKITPSLSYTLTPIASSSVIFFLNNRDYTIPEVLVSTNAGPTASFNFTNPLILSYLAGAGTQFLQIDNSGNVTGTAGIPGLGTVTEVKITASGLVSVSGNCDIVSSGTCAIALSASILTGTPTNHGIALGSTAQALNFTAAGTLNQCLLSAGAAADPSFATCPVGFTLTTTGSSGAATFIGTVLNIPNYAGGGGTPGGSNTQLQYNNSGAFGGMAEFTYASSKITGSAAALFDLSAATGASAFKIPVVAGLTVAVNGALGYDSTNNMLHAAQSSADAFVPQSTVTPINAHCATWVVSGSNYKLGDAICSAGGSSALSAITAATGANTIANGDNAQIWNWAETTGGRIGFKIGETSASTGNASILELISTLSGSLAIPLEVANTLSGSQILPTLSLNPTWNTTGVVDAALLINVINTASGVASKLLDLQVGGTTQFNIDVNGNTTILGSVFQGSSPPSFTGGTSAAQGWGEGTAPTGCAAANVECIFASSTQHGFLTSYNNGAILPLPQGPATSTINDAVCFGSITGALLADCGAAPVLTTRTISTTSPLGGGGALSSNLTFTCTTCLINNGVNTGTAAITIDLSASTVSNAFKSPAQAGLTITATGATGEDSTATMYHNFTGGVDSLLITVPTSLLGSIANNDCPKFVKTGSLLSLTTSGGACGAGGGAPVAGTGISVSGSTVSFNPFDKTIVWYKNDFTSGAYGSVAMTYATAEGTWVVETPSVGTGVAQIAGVAQHPGITELSTGTTSSANILIQQGDSVNTGREPYNNLATNTNWEADWNFRLNSTALIGIRIGLAAGTSITIADGMFLRYDTANGDTNFMFVCVKTGASTTAVSSGVAADTNFHTVRIVSTSAGNIDFYLDSGAVNHACTSGTNVPTANVGLEAGLITNTTANKTFDLDWVSFQQTGLTR